MHPGHEPHSERYDDAAYAYCVGRFAEAAATFADLVRIECAPAAMYLGQMYLRGEGVPVDIGKGLELLRTAAAWGYSLAAYNLGAVHRSGAYGVPENAAESRRYFLLARKLGCELAIDDAWVA